MATTYPNVPIPAEARPVLGTPRTGFQPQPGYLTWATRWLADAVVIGFAAYGAAHLGVPLDRFPDIEPPL